MARVVFATVGTLGDLHPSLAIARALADRGHVPVVATHPGYRTRVEAAGLAFHPAGPDIEAHGDLALVMKQAMHERRGSEYVVRRLVLPHLRATYDDLTRACAGADCVVTHMLSFAGALVAERLGLPRIGQILQPFTMLSAHDPPVTPALPGSAWLRTLGPTLWGPLWWLGRASSRGWFRDVDALRATIGLPRSTAHPLFDGFSPLLNLAMFSPVLASPQSDWPPHTVVTGF